MYTAYRITTRKPFWRPLSAFRCHWTVGIGTIRDSFSFEHSSDTRPAKAECDETVIPARGQTVLNPPGIRRPTGRQHD